MTFGWKAIRRAWVTFGIATTIAWIGWCLWAYRATDEAQAALAGDARVSVTRGEGWWTFASTSNTRSDTGLVFFAGALVDPVAYAPVARAVADAGHAVLLVELPRRAAFGGADDGEVIGRAQRAMASVPVVSRWFVGGHSKGAAVAARFVREAPGKASGLILVGTTHPRDFSLAAEKIPVTKIQGTLDGVAPREKSEANRNLLPPATRWVWIEGGNHSQFGAYGFQPMDRFATIDGPTQRAQTVRAIRDALAAAPPP